MAMLLCLWTGYSEPQVFILGRFELNWHGI